MRDIGVTINGSPLALDCQYGDVEMSTSWPGGSDELSWSATGMPAHLATGGALVCGYCGPWLVWSGALLEPDPSQDRLTAQGLWRLGDNYAALTSGGVATLVPNTAIDQAISRGLPWSRPTSIQTTAVDDDVSQGPMFVGALLDSMTEQTAKRWGVDPFGVVYQKVDDTAPTYQVLPLEGGMGFSLDGYASTLIGRYYNGTTYSTATRTDTVAEGLHGHVEYPIDLTVRGTLTSGKANTILDNILALGRSTPKFLSGVTVAYGELLTMGGTPVALETVQAGKVLRIPGGPDLARSQSGLMYVDMLIGATSLSGGLLSLQPMQATATTFTDIMTKALKDKKGSR